ncbi:MULTISPECIES: flagellar protein FlgN [Paenibacillus]|uniref:Flagellar protein FlgN n=1 Tax=Paenibacillus alvei TaxID=44250 RepID=A0ABT4E8G1_PAEAL|nr:MULTISPECIES: flagellar protein FlgN [Paenibacillus]MCY9528651.1 flagellar protein FlgN [Paenibacillus alvei]SDG23773.1 FlgN protein [Paenibacillus sp. cl6col]
MSGGTGVSVQQIIGTLTLLNDLHKQLLDIAEEKKQVIIKNDVEGLSQLMTKESRLLKQVAEVDEDRQQATQQFILEKGIRSQLNLTVTEIARLVFQAEERVELLRSKEELTRTIEKLKKVNLQNQQLIQQSLEFVDFSLNMFLGAEDDGFYQRPDQQHGSSRNKTFFDTKA